MDIDDGLLSHSLSLALGMVHHGFIWVENGWEAPPLPSIPPERGQMPGFHELRALSLHLHKKAGKYGQKIAGHASGKMTRNYEADHEDVVWSEAVPDLDISKITG